MTSGRTSSAGRWIQGYRANREARLRLFCLPYAGGGASAFRAWAGMLPPWVELCALQLPGRENRLREPPITSFDSLVTHLIAVLKEHLDLPYALFGHSMGALLGFEVARGMVTLSDAVPLPSYLFLSGCRAPRLPDDRPPIHTLPHDEFIAKLRELGGTPEEILQHEELLDLLLPLIRADFQLVADYRYRAADPLPMPLVVYGGSDDREVPVTSLAAWREEGPKMRMRIFAGNHFFLVSALAELIGDITMVLSGTLY